MARTLVAYLSLLGMILGAIAVIGGLCAALSGTRAFVLPLLLVGLVVLVIASIGRWRTASARPASPVDERANGHVDENTHG